MAEFCRQCTPKAHQDHNDFIGLTPLADWEEGKGQMVLCEGCGYTIVDPLGYCVCVYCLTDHALPPLTTSFLKFHKFVETSDNYTRKSDFYNLVVSLDFQDLQVVLPNGRIKKFNIKMIPKTFKVLLQTVYIHEELKEDGRK